MLRQSTMMHTTTKQQLDETIRRIDGAYAPATIRAYRADFDAFIQFCSALGEGALPASPIVVAQFVENLAKTPGGHLNSPICGHPKIPQ
jgi:hypothetical protein